MSAAHIKFRVVVPMVFLPLLAFAQTASLPPQPLTVKGATTYMYKSIGGDQLRLHAFSPQSSRGIARKPAIVFFFGGGWTSGAITQFVPQATQLAERGMVAIVADYRVFNRHGTSAFEAMTDAKSALRWVRAHSAELGVDTNRIAASGGSSGGHVALSAAIFDTFDEPGEDKTVSSKPKRARAFQSSGRHHHDPHARHARDSEGAVRQSRPRRLPCSPSARWPAAYPHSSWEG